MAAESENQKLPDPNWRAEDLGRAMPDSVHAASVCMPLWEHNVAYEEGDAEVVDAFRSGYPRFFINPLVTELRERLAKERNIDPSLCLPLPTESSAKRCRDYVMHRTDAPAEFEETNCGIWLVETSNSGAGALGEFWQHSGEIVSSRTAGICLSGGSQQITATAAKSRIRQNVAMLQHVAPEDVYLYPSGMAAIYAAWRITRQVGAAPIQFGFPYVDTFKILERFGKQPPLFFPRGSTEEIDELEKQLGPQRTSALFCEVPGNPLLTTPDLRQLNALAESHGFRMVVDDTLSAMINTDVRPYADLIATSLTKFFSGAGDVLAGSLILVRDRPGYAEIKERLEADYEDMFADMDAEVLAENCKDTRERVIDINQAADELVAALKQHPAVERVYFPSETSADEFEVIRERRFLQGGHGGLLSLLLKDAGKTAPRVYDALRICKGPNLGTNFTLCCPYTILAHYDELEFAQECGVSPYLLRISVGTEGAAWIVERVVGAINEVCGANS